MALSNCGEQTGSSFKERSLKNFLPHLTILFLASLVNNRKLDSLTHCVVTKQLWGADWLKLQGEENKRNCFPHLTILFLASLVNSKKLDSLTHCVVTKTNSFSLLLYLDLGLAL